MKIDGRKHSHEALESIRRMAMQRVQEGESPSAVIKSYGMSRTAIYRWMRAVDERGDDALRSRKASGRPRSLTPKQGEQVRKWINGKDPRQYGFDFGLWTRRIVAALIEKRMGVHLSVTAVGRLLATLGITPQKPLRRAYERDPEAVERWKRDEFPEIKRKAAAAGADVFFLDEAGIRSDAPPGKTWAPRGQTPVVATTGQRQSVNAISAVNPKGAFWYETFTGRLNATLFRTFLRRFLAKRRRPVFLVVDGHPAHKARLVQDFVRDMAGRLEIFRLPGYAPDLNPDEFVWNQVKTHGISKRPLLRNESLRERIETDLSNIRADRALIRSFFRAPSVAYVLD